MALQLRRLFTKSTHRWNLSNPPRVTSTMLQLRLGQGLPSVCFRNPSFLNNKKYGSHPCAAVKTINSNLSRFEILEYTSSAPGIRCGPSCKTLGNGSCSGINYFSGDIICRRLFSSAARKKSQAKAKSKSQSEAQIFENKSKGNENTAPEVVRGSKKKEKSSTSDSVNGEINTTVVKSPKIGAVKSRKGINKTTNAGECTEKSVKDAGKKIKAAERSSDKDFKAPKKNNQKGSSKTNNEELSAQSTSSKAKSSKRRSRESMLSATDGSNAANIAYQKASSGVKGQKMQFKPLYPPTGKSVMVVESATKAKVIQKYLGDMYEVLPSYGHVRDLAARSKSVRPDNGFSMVWEVPAAAWTHLKNIKVALNGAQNLILASDPDREGEAIAWHLTEMLQQQDALNENITVARVGFHEITESSIKKSLQAPREIDMNLVNAYLARRALDYLIGFSISPLLWRKLPGCQSAGRVQSAALALICDREMDIEQFNEQEYWKINVEFQDENLDTLSRTSILSHLTHLNSKRMDKLSVGSRMQAESVEKQVMSSKFEVKNVKTSKVQRNPPMPYITSTLQQDSANKLHLTAAQTMKLAQNLYEGVKLSNEEATGLITYMRTDGLHISNEAAEDIHSFVKERYGVEYASKNIRKYFRKVKNAQEAHEAIRPTSIRRLPSSLTGILDDDSLKLYTLIWSRTMACQMESASSDMIQVDIGSVDGGIIFRAASSQVASLGFRAVFEDKEGQLNENNEEEEDANGSAFAALHKLKVGNSLNVLKVHLCQHYTQPPPRYSEAALVKNLEELGIGRPSTYASIVKVLQDRHYILSKNRVLHPEFRGRMVSAFLLYHFSEVADYSFTADLESELDNVSAGTTEWKGLLEDYWSRFTTYFDLASSTNIRQVEQMLEEKFGHMLFDSSSNRVCPSCLEGTLKLKLSRFGAGYFIGCNQHPSCKYIAQALIIRDDDNDDEVDNPGKWYESFPSKLIGSYPGSDEKVYIKKGPFGFYVQLGEDKKGHAQPPKRAALYGFKDVEAVTLENAVDLLQYPKKLGLHPKDNYPVVLTMSRLGFLIKHRRNVAPVPKSTDPKTITLETGLKFLSSKNARQFGRKKVKAKIEIEEEEEEEEEEAAWE